MTDFTQQPGKTEGDGPPREVPGGKPNVVRKVAMIAPGFRDVQDQSVLRPRILGIKQPQDPQDRRNLKFLILAILVAVAIFGALEYKQIHDAGHEAKKSVMDFFKRQ